MLRLVKGVESSSVAADHNAAVETLPVDRSMVRAFRSPVQAEVVKLAVNAKLSPATGCRLDVAAAARRTLTAEHLDRFVQQVPAGPGVVIAHPSSAQTCAALRAGGGALASLVAARSEHVVLDLGRWCPDGAAHGFVQVCSRLIVVMRPALEQIVQLLHLIDTTFPIDRLGVVVIGRQQFSARQIVDVTGLASVHELPDDAAAVRGDPCAAGERPRARWAARIRELAERCA